MPNFTYQAFDLQGRKKKGTIDAASADAAMAKLEQSGLTPISVIQGQKSLPWWHREIHLFGSSTYKSSEILVFFEGLSTGLDAKVPLSRALQICANTVATPKMSLLLEKVSDGVANGQTLEAAIASEAADFPSRLLQAIALGETSNNLATVIAETVVSLRSEARLRKEVQQALIYPIILVVVSFVVVSILIFYLTPTLMPVFDSAGAPAPFVIRAMMATRSSLLNDWLLILTGLSAGFLVFLMFRKALSRVAMPALTKLPILRDYFRQRNTLQLCRTLHLMLSSGSTLLQALITSAHSVEGTSMRAMLSEATVKIEAGDTFRNTVLNSNLIEKTASMVLATGEEADRLPQLLVPTIVRLEAETGQTISQFVKLLTPILTLVLGIFVGTIILSTVSAIMDLNDAVL